MKKTIVKNKLKELKRSTTKRLWTKIEEQWKLTVKARDNFKCQFPGGYVNGHYESGCTKNKYNERLHVHHCINDRVHKATFVLPENGITLCMHHHFHWAHSVSGGRDLEAFLRNRLGSDSYDSIIMLGRGIAKYSAFDLEKMIEELKQQEQNYNETYNKE